MSDENMVASIVPFERTSLEEKEQGTKLAEVLTPEQTAERLFDLGFRLSKPITTTLTDTDNEIYVKNVYVPDFEIYFADGVSRNVESAYTRLGIPKQDDWAESDTVMNHLYDFSESVGFDPYSINRPVECDFVVLGNLIDFLTNPEISENNELATLNMVVDLKFRYLGKDSDQLDLTRLDLLNGITEEDLSPSGIRYEFFSEYMQLEGLAGKLAHKFLTHGSSFYTITRGGGNEVFFKGEGEFNPNILCMDYRERVPQIMGFFEKYQEAYSDSFRLLVDQLFEDIDQRSGDLYGADLNSIFTRRLLGRDFIEEVAERIYPESGTKLAQFMQKVVFVEHPGDSWTGYVVKDGSLVRNSDGQVVSSLPKGVFNTSSHCYPNMEFVTQENLQEEFESINMAIDRLQDKVDGLVSERSYVEGLLAETSK